MEEVDDGGEEVDQTVIVHDLVDQGEHVTPALPPNPPLQQPGSAEAAQYPAYTFPAISYYYAAPYYNGQNYYSNYPKHEQHSDSQYSLADTPLSQVLSPYLNTYFAYIHLKCLAHTFTVKVKYRLILKLAMNTRLAAAKVCRAEF